jgi:hypothetical protein
MQGIHDATAAASLPAPPTLAGTIGYWTEGVPGITAPTLERGWWFNMVQEELLAILTAASVTPDTTAASFGQVVASIQALIAAVPHGVQAISTSGNFTVPTGVTAIQVELWAGGSGSWASVSGTSGGGGSGGGFARKFISGLTPGASISVTIGAGGVAGSSGVAPTAGGSSSFASYCSATGGVVNPLGTVSVPNLGNTAGVGTGGDLNLFGGDGGQGQGNQSIAGGTYVGNLGGYGGDGALSGGIVNSAGVGLVGRFPGGGASGAGSGTSGTTANNGAAGAAGLCIVRW